MVEHCIQLFGRIPDGRLIDECFVEIRNLSSPQTKQRTNGFNNWLERSLGRSNHDQYQPALGTTIESSRNSTNSSTIFSDWAYTKSTKGTGRKPELAFAVGNIGELLYLFEEHLHYDAETGSEAIRLPVFSFYEH